MDMDTGNPIARLAEHPGESALLLDIDGTLAPIVDRPEDASVPGPTRALLRELADRYALVACVSGRPEDEARRIVGIDEIDYIGEHGLALDPAAAEWQGPIDELVAAADWPPERKRSSVAFHYRRVADETAAVAELRRVEHRAIELGLKPRWGRKVLEVLPPVEANKGTAVRRLLGQHGLSRALYAGDDATDLDAFRALDGLAVAVRVAVVSEEGPSELGRAADVIVGGTEALVDLLRSL
jgi:trehalose 6-phosphate phosphatase